MKSLVNSIKKEFMEASRSKRSIALIAMALFFALFDPVVLKLTPYILKEVSGIDLGDMIQLTQIAELKEFYQDIYQLYSIVLIIVIGNTWLNELKDQTLIIPISKGIKVSQIIIAKMITYSLLVNIIMLVAYSINYLYSGIIFGFTVDYYQILTSSILMGVFFTFCICFIISLSVVVSNYPAVIFLSLLMLFGGPIITKLFRIGEYTPFGLLSEASLFPRILTSSISVTFVCVMILLVFVYYFGTIIANKKEIIKYR